MGQTGQRGEGDRDGGQLVVGEAEAGQPAQPGERRVHGGQAVVGEIQDLQ